MLKIIEEYLCFMKIDFEKIDGSTKAKDRQASIDRFTNNKDKFEVFLLSTKAGGIGINLTSAKIVIIYDSDWNP
jgi:SNF2 family DNA or RNA helicase